MKQALFSVILIFTITTISLSLLSEQVVAQTMMSPAFASHGYAIYDNIHCVFKY